MNFTSSYDPGAPRERGRITMADPQHEFRNMASFGIGIVAFLIWMFMFVSPLVPTASWSGVGGEMEVIGWGGPWVVGGVWFVGAVWGMVGAGLCAGL